MQKGVYQYIVSAIAGIFIDKQLKEEVIEENVEEVVKNKLIITDNKEIKDILQLF
jgi:hypothetical protein